MKKDKTMPPNKIMTNLSRYNQYRRGHIKTMDALGLEAKEIGETIDAAIDYIRQTESRKPNKFQS